MSKSIPYRSDYFEVDLEDYAPAGTDPWHDPDDMLRACVRARADDVVIPGAKPPTLALLPLQRELFDPPHPDMDAGTRGLLREVYHGLDPDDPPEDLAHLFTGDW